MARAASSSRPSSLASAVASAAGGAARGEDYRDVIFERGRTQEKGRDTPSSKAPFFASAALQLAAATIGAACAKSSACGLSGQDSEEWQGRCESSLLSRGRQRLVFFLFFLLIVVGDLSRSIRREGSCPTILSSRALSVVWMAAMLLSTRSNDSTKTFFVE